jgi:hypothetical protein
MKPWLDGDLSGVDPSRDLEALRGVALAAAHRDVPLDAMYAALGRADPRILHELAAGPRAIGHPASVRAAISVGALLESVVDPAGLYPRLAELSPDLGVEALAMAARRHPKAEWVIRWSRQRDPVPGRIHLQAAAEVGQLAEVCDLLAREGVDAGLLSLAAEGMIEPIAAFWRAGRPDDALTAAAACLDAAPSAPAIGALAALSGPGLGRLLDRLLPRVRSTVAADRVRWARVEA